MSVYSLTTASEKAIGMLLTAGGGSETLLLRRPANELRAELHLEPAGRTLTAVILLGHQRNTLTLQDGDGANQLNLADYIEAIANGTADTAATGRLGEPAMLLACRQCGSEAIGCDYADPAQTDPGPTRFLNAVKCRYGDCCTTRGHATPQLAAQAWNAIQSEPLPAKEPFALCAQDEASLRNLARIGGTRHLQCDVSITVHNALQDARRYALVTIASATQLLEASTPGELYVQAAQHIEAALNAA